MAEKASSVLPVLADARGHTGNVLDALKQR